MPSSTTTRTAVVDAAGHTLRADATASYLRMLTAGMPAGGVDVFTRTMAEQQALYERYLRGAGPVAARPTTSAPHIDGRAIDLHTTTAGRYDPSDAHRWLTAGGDGSSKPKAGENLRAHTYGWFRTVPSERWHFEYNRAKDTKRAADLAARLKALGYRTLLEFQKAHGLAADGVDGPLTWAALLGAPTPREEPVPTVALDFTAAQYNVQAKRWGGTKYPLDAKFVRHQLQPDVLFTQESDETARTAIVERTGMKVWAFLYLGLYWRPEIFSHGARMVLPLGTSYHGAVATTLTGDGLSFVACSVHIRPRAAFASKAAADKGRRADIATVIAWLAEHPRVVVGGDWNTADVFDLMSTAGYTLATPRGATTDGGKSLDAIFVRGLSVRSGVIVPTDASDHHGLRAGLTISTTTTA